MTLNSSGGIAGFDDYYPFGAQMPGRSSVSSAEFRYRFTGKERDVNETGWDYFGARYYDSRIGRWLQVDPLVDWEVAWSPYNYVRNNPVNAVDRDGRIGETLFDIASVAVSLYEFVKEPSWENGAYLAGDVGATLIPFVPAPTAVKTAVKLAEYVDDVTDGAKVIDKGNDLQKTYQTYTKTNMKTGEVYTGRTSGTKTPKENIAQRDRNHHMNEKGYGQAKLDKSSNNPKSIRGREQEIIEKNGGAKSKGGKSGNSINGISDKNPNKKEYIEQNKKEFKD